MLGLYKRCSWGMTVCRSECTKNKSHRTYVSRAHTSHLAHRTYLPLIAQIPRLPLGGVPCLGLDGTGSRGFVARISTLFRGSFEVVWPFSVGRRSRGIIRGSAIRSSRSNFPSHPKEGWPTSGNSKCTTIVLASETLYLAGYPYLTVVQ